jgi:uncharacterized protein YciI
MKFVLYAKDKAGALPIRQANREAHLAFINQPSTVRILTAGPLLNPDGDMCGSMFVLEAPNEDTVKAWMKNDPYVKAGLFDSAELHPFIWVVGAP